MNQGNRPRYAYAVACAVTDQWAAARNAAFGSDVGGLSRIMMFTDARSVKRTFPDAR